MKIDLSQFRQTFMQESTEHVESMEAGLLALRSAPDDAEILNAIFRSAHSIKGGAGSFGLTNLVRFTHALENLLDRLRSLEMPATAEVISLLLRAVDVLRAMLDAGGDGGMPEGAAVLAEQIESLCAEEPKEESLESAPSERQEVSPGEILGEGPAGPELNFYQVQFRPHRGMFSSGTNPIMLLRNLAALGTVSVCHLHAEDLPPLEQLDPSQCYLSWTVELASSRPEEELLEVFEFVVHLAEISVRRAVQGPQREKGFPPWRLFPLWSRTAWNRSSGERRRTGESRKSRPLRRSRAPSAWPRRKSTG
jgi:two-component system chemotaxis sensor kinase CheA